MLWGMENQRVTALVCIDLSAAFDTVHHDVLLEVLENKFGVADTALSWFDSYLRPRTAKVMIGEHSSNLANLTFSVPQGSIGGPSIYNTHASTLQSYIRQFNVSILRYADDHSIYDSFDPKSDSDRHTVIKNLESCLVSINTWMTLNRLKMNSSKTEFILFGSRVQLQRCSDCQIVVCDANIQQSSSVKYLGLHMDDQLTFNIQIREKCRTASANLFYIRQIRDYLSKELCQQLVQFLVISQLDYANAVYYGLPTSTLAPLQRLQNQAAKLILKRGRYDSASEALRTLHWLPVAYRCQFKVACLVHRCLMGRPLPILRISSP